MKIQHLEDIVAICEAGSFRKAALKLGITQPTLSKRIAYLESRLEVPLFQRTHGRTQPTAISRFIAERAASIVQQGQNLIAETYQVAQGRGGTVRIGFGPAPSHSFLTEVISLCRKSSPQLTLETVIGSTEQLSALMQNGKIDLAVCPMDQELFVAPFDTRLLLEENIVIAATPDHPIFSEAFDSPARFFSYQVVLPVLEPRYRALTRKLYNLDIAKLKNLVLCSDYSVLLKLVTSDDFVTAGPAFVFREAVKQGQLKVMVMDERVKHRVHLIINRSGLNFPALEHVILNIREAVNRLTA